MTNRPRKIGTAAETALVNLLRANGWGNAERRPLHGSQDWGDIYGTPGIAWEVKAGEQARAYQPGDVTRWLEQTENERHHSSSDIGVLVMVRWRKLAPQWWAIIPAGQLISLGMGAIGTEATQCVDLNDLAPALYRKPVWLEVADLIPLLHAAGYGDPVEAIA